MYPIAQQPHTAAAICAPCAAERGGKPPGVPGIQTGVWVHCPVWSMLWSGQYE